MKLCPGCSKTFKSNNFFLMPEILLSSARVSLHFFVIFANISCTERTWILQDKKGRFFFAFLVIILVSFHDRIVNQRRPLSFCKIHASGRGFLYREYFSDDQIYFWKKSLCTGIHNWKHGLSNFRSIYILFKTKDLC